MVIYTQHSQKPTCFPSSLYDTELPAGGGLASSGGLWGKSVPFLGHCQRSYLV